MKSNAVCVDIERASFNGPISVIGWYEPRDGLIECNHFVRGVNLSTANLRETFKKYQLVITYNGRCYDMPAIQSQFPDAFRNSIVILDLYLLAKKLSINASLKTLENSFNIDRSDMSNLKRISPIRLWQRYEKQGDRKALSTLLEYNRQDTANLYPLAEKLMSFIGSPIDFT